MWNSFRTDDRAAITAEVITYPGDGLQLLQPSALRLREAARTVGPDGGT
jgi:hypothetical protein